MNRTRASSLESHKNLCDKYDSFSSSINPNKLYRRNRIQSFVGKEQEYSDCSASTDFYYKNDYKRPVVGNAELKSQFDILQCTVNRMLNGGVFDEMGSSIPSINLSEALKHEYRQMMSALKELENILGCKRKPNETGNYSNMPNNDNAEIHQMQREIYYRDSLIKCLSDRLKVLCKANDKLIIDYENQENILSEELICLKRQLEKAKDALRSLSAVKSRSNISAMQSLENEAYYLQESLRNKELMISDLKHRLDKVNRDNTELKCKLENKEVLISHYEANGYDRDISYNNRLNEQLKVENDYKTQLIKDLQNKLDLANMAHEDYSMINQLKNELLLAHKENDMSKNALLEQSDILNDFKNQIEILSENNHFQEETICELRCCIRQLTEYSPENIPIRDQNDCPVNCNKSSQSIETKSNSINSFLNFIKKYLAQNQPDLLYLLECELDTFNALKKFIIDIVGMTEKTDQSDIELFKEFLTNEINLKNSIIKFLTSNLTGDIESLEKLQGHMNSILSLDMDRGFKQDLKNYLHNCFLLDDNLRLVIEYLVKSINTLSSQNQALSLENISLIEKNAIYVPNKMRDIQSIDTNSRLTSTINSQDNDLIRISQVSSQSDKIKALEEEIQILREAHQRDRKRFNSELEDKNDQIQNLKGKILDLQKIIDDKSRIEIEYRRLNSEHKELLNKSKEWQYENDRLQGEIEVLSVKNQQIDRNLQMKNSELENLNLPMLHVSDQFADLSSTQEQVKKSIESNKDAEIEKLNKEIDELKVFKIKFNELKLSNNENSQRNSMLSKNVELLDIENYEMKNLINSLQRELDKSNMEKLELLDSIANLEDDIKKLTEELRVKVVSFQLKSNPTDDNNELTETMEKLKQENQKLMKQLQKDELQEIQLKSSVKNLKIENKTMEIKNNSINSDKNALENQIKQLRERISEINRNCEDNHVSKLMIKSETDQSDIYKQKVVDLEGILVCLTDELHEKVELVDNLRKLVKNDECAIPCADPCVHDTVDINQQLLIQKDSENAFLKSKIEILEKRSATSQSRLPSLEMSLSVAEELKNLHMELAENDKRIEHLNQQLNERSENLTNLQQLFKEKDEIIENSLKIIKVKTDALDESEKMLHSMTLENTNIKEDMSNRFQDESQIKLLNTTIKNLTNEIENLRTENDKLRLEITRLNSEKQKLSIQQKSSLPPIAPVQSDNSVEQINNEIHKLYVDFEGKSNEIREYSLKEIKNRDRKIDELNLELKLKSDQFSTIMVENRRLLDKIEDESQRSSKYEQNLLLKEQLLAKMLKDKEKIRATFITELHSKNEELNEKNKTVYFLNTELHRLASEVEVLNSELHVVKISDNYQVQSKNTLEITQTNLKNLKVENNSLRLCINLKMAELESMKNELTVKQIHNEKLSNELELSNSKSKDFEIMKRDSMKTEDELKNLVDELTCQLTEIQENYRNIMQTKSIIESALKELENENLSLKQTKELLENEKSDYKTEINDLQLKIEALTNNLVDTKNQIIRMSLTSENEQQEIRRLLNIIQTNEKSIGNQSKTLNQAIQQIDELTEENLKYKMELEKISNQFYELEEEYRILSGKQEKTNEELKAKEIEIQRYKDMENELNNGMNLKSIYCDQLKKEYDCILKQCEDFQEKFNQFENVEQEALRSIEQKDIQCVCLQENLEYLQKQLYLTEDKLKCCNNQWLEKYGQLKCSYEQMECQYLQFQNQIDTLNRDRELLETTVGSHNNKIICLSESYHKLNEENSHMIQANCLKDSELQRLCCEKSKLENCNMELTGQLESINNQLRNAHREICDLTNQISVSQLQANGISSKLNENLPSVRHYGSHPLLSKIDMCKSDMIDFDHRDYCDFKTRYTSLCCQIDNLISQLKKKDKRLMELQTEKEIISRNFSNYEQIQCDYQDLDYKYQQLKDDYNNLSHYYQNINFSHQQNFEFPNHEISVIQGCANELQETIECHNREIDELKLSQQALENDYRFCCNRVKDLENQIQIDNIELEKWNQSYCDSKNKYKLLEEKFDQLKHAYDDAIGQLDQFNELKQELIDKTNRINEITNINDNIEQQIIKTHQQINNQNQIIDNYKAKLNEMELYYEREIEQYRHELKFAEQFNPSTDYEELINCIKAKNQSLECDLLDLQDKYQKQNLNFKELKNEQECLLIKTEQLKQEYDQQCTNIDKLSGQLFDKNDLIEQITAENHQMNAELELNQLKLCQLTEQNECLNKFLKEKNTELIMAVENTVNREQESIELSNHAEYLTDQLKQRNSVIEDFKKELSINYESIEEMKQENSKLCSELEKLTHMITEKDQIITSKNEFLNQYCKEIKMNYELINKLKSEHKLKSSISAKEFFEMKQINEKLNEELEYLHRKLDPNIQSIETQTQKDKNQIELNPTNYLLDSPSPISDFREYNERDSFTKVPSEENKETDLTFSTSKSVAWKSTHTDLPQNVGAGVLELQKAIDEYNTLVTSIEMSEGILNLSSIRESTRNFQKITTENLGKSGSPDLSMNPKINIDVQQTQEKNDEVDVIVVDVDSMRQTSEMLNSNVPIDVQNVINEETVQHFHQPNFQNVIDLLINCNVQIDFDETKETFEVYFQRMMKKYNELEQFYLASMKINLDIIQDSVDIQNLEVFTELYEKSHQKLIQNCQLLKSSISCDILELHDDLQLVNSQKLTTENLTKFVDLITTQQLQLGILNLAYRNIENITQINDEQSNKVTATYLTQEYQKIWLVHDVCNPNIVSAASKANQLSLDKEVILEIQSKDFISAINILSNTVESEKILQNLTIDPEKARLISDDPKLKLGLSKEFVMEKETFKQKSKQPIQESAYEFIEQPIKELILKTSMKITRSSQRNDTQSLRFPLSNEDYNVPEILENEIPLNLGLVNLDSSVVERSKIHMNSGQEFQQNIYKGSSVRESKTQPIDNLEDKISYASIGQFEKSLNQLNNIDFDNFYGSIDAKDQVRIYTAEIDYLNEKNLFHTYAINTIANATRYPLNTNFLHQITTSLTSKAKFIDSLQKEFKFDPHISKKEKELMDRIIDTKNDFTFEKLFEKWINEMGLIENQKHTEELTEKVQELTKNLEFCQSQIKATDIKDNGQLIETLIAEKKLLSDQLNECMLGIGKTNKENSPLVMKSPGSDMEGINQQFQAYKSTIEHLTKENEHLKEIIKYGSDKGQSIIQDYSHEKSKQSKIPLLKGSTIEGGSITPNIDRKSMKWDDVNKRLLNDMTNISKNINQVTESVKPFRHTDNNADKLVQASKEIANASTKMNQEISEIRSSRGDQKSKNTINTNDKSLLQSSGKLVSPEEVKSAIESETSIESLKKFACLLAEDNFDLAAEIEKLLVTIEELRRQLKENCEILSETVDMLQNSENFVNQMEKKLNIETKKTQVITTRIDKLNELNGRVILEVERILKQPPSTLTTDMNSLERYDYLFECLKKIEVENISLLTKKEELEHELMLIKSCNTYNFLGPILTGPIDFEFETSLLPNGSIEGTINLSNNDDISKKLSLTFDVNMNKDDKLETRSRDSKTLSHFLIEREASHSDIRSIPFSLINKTKTDYSFNNKKGNNNNCCYRDAKCCLSKSLIDIPKIYSSFDNNNHMRVCCLNSNPTNYRSQNLKSTYHYKMKSNRFFKTMSSSDSLLKFEFIDLNISSLSHSRFSSSFMQSSESNIDLHSSQSMSSISGGTDKKVQFINYRKPIYFRSIYERL